MYYLDKDSIEHDSISTVRYEEEKLHTLPLDPKLYLARRKFGRLLSPRILAETLQLLVHDYTGTHVSHVSSLGKYTPYAVPI